MVDSETISIPDDLFVAARRGDPKALADLWTTCEPALTLALREARPIPSTIQVSDVTQEAAEYFLKLVRDDASGDSQRFLAELRRLLPHKLRAYLRAERRRLGRQVRADTPKLEQALARASNSGTNRRVPGHAIARAIQRLSPRQRAVINGLYFREAPATAIASELGLTAQAVSAVHRRALVTLEEAISQSQSQPRHDERNQSADNDEHDQPH